MCDPSLPRRPGGLAGIAGAVALLHLLGWGGLTAIAAGGRLGAILSGGVGVTAYVLGVRHAFDADHIAAIDNTTRRLLQDGRPSASTGFWFALGHSTIVFLLALALALGLRAVAASVTDSGSGLYRAAGVVGAVVSGGFLYIIAGLNLVALADVWTALRRARRGRALAQAALEAEALPRGLASRLIGRWMQTVAEPSQMYLVGLLFGLGFDTASEIGLLVLTGSGAAAGLPWYAVMCLPVLFAAGMSLFDSLDGVLMSAAYGWALVQPDRKILYNLIVTGLSVAVALAVGAMQMASLLSGRLKPHGAVWRYLDGLDPSLIGLGVAGLFAAAWLSAAVIWRLGRNRSAGGSAAAQRAEDHQLRTRRDRPAHLARLVLPDEDAHVPADAVLLVDDAELQAGEAAVEIVEGGLHGGAVSLDPRLARGVGGQLRGDQHPHHQSGAATTE